VSSREDSWRSGRDAWERLRRWFADARDGRDGQALDALTDIGRLRYLLDQAELAAVKAARRAGDSWAEIATRLGVTRQSAWERWRELDESESPVVPRPVDEASEILSGVVDGVVQELSSTAARRQRRRSKVTVPNVVGLRLDAARLQLVSGGLVPVGSDPDASPEAAFGWPTGVVTDQSPEAGARVPAGTLVMLWLGHGGGSGGVREPRRPLPGPKGLVADPGSSVQEVAG